MNKLSKKYRIVTSSICILIGIGKTRMRENHREDALKTHHIQHFAGGQRGQHPLGDSPGFSEATPESRVRLWPLAA